MFANGRFVCFIAGMAVVLVFATCVARAQDNSDKGSVVQELIRQNAQLREEIDILKSRVARLETRDKTLPSQPSVAESVPISPSQPVPPSAGPGARIT